MIYGKTSLWKFYDSNWTKYKFKGENLISLTSLWDYVFIKIWPDKDNFSVCAVCH